MFIIYFHTQFILYFIHVCEFVRFATIFNAQCMVVDHVKLINAQISLY